MGHFWGFQFSPSASPTIPQSGNPALPVFPEVNQGRLMAWGGEGREHLFTTMSETGASGSGLAKSFEKSSTQPVHGAAVTATLSLPLNSCIPKAAHTTPRGKPGVPSTHPSQLVTQLHLVLCLKNVEHGVPALPSSLLCLNGVKSP